MSESTPLIFTTVAILTWFWIVFRRLYRERHAVRIFTDRMTDGILTLSQAFVDLGKAAEATIPAFVALGQAMRETVAQLVDSLSPKQREIYDELISIGVLPVDAVRESIARWPD